VFSDSVANRIATLRDFPSNPRTWLKYQQWMRECVIANYVAFLGDLSGDIRPLTHITSDQEKRAAHIVLGQHFKQVHRARIIRSIIECEGNLLRAMLPGMKGPAKPLPRGSHRLVSRRYNCSTGNGSETEHAAILNAFSIQHSAFSN
jgi:hypothetical protein